MQDGKEMQAHAGKYSGLVASLREQSKEFPVHTGSKGFCFVKGLRVYSLRNFGSGSS